MFGKETGDITNDAKITMAGQLETALEQMSDGSMDYLAENKSKHNSDVSKIKRTKITHK